MADQNLVSSQDLKALSIDFVNNFSNGVHGLLTALQGVQLRPMAQGSTIKTYKTTVTKAASRTVGEGEEIPLTHFTRKEDKTYTLQLTDKLRKETSYEAIRSAGSALAIQYTDQQLLGIAQKNAKQDLFDALDSKATTKINAGGFQQAISKSLGKLTALFEDLDGAGSTVVFVNPDDFYDYLGNQQISVQTQFGLSYIKNFLNAGTIIMSANVPSGHVYATVNNNLKFYYIPQTGEAGAAFDMQTDQTGLIGITHFEDKKALVYDSVVVGGWLILPELSDGIVNATITTADSKSAGTPASKQLKGDAKL